eukprot:2084404-Rhodomonas_salina.3
MSATVRKHCVVSVPSPNRQGVCFWRRGFVVCVSVVAMWCGAYLSRLLGDGLGSERLSGLGGADVV